MFNTHVVKHQELHQQMLSCYLHDYPKIQPVTDWRAICEDVNDREVYESKDKE